MSINKRLQDLGKVGLAALVAVLWAAGGVAQAAHDPHDIEGITGTSVNGSVEFNLTADDGYLSTGDGNSVYFWGYADGTGPVQYPGPTLIVNENAVVTITLKNDLPVVNTSMVFPGQVVTSAVGDDAGLLTAEAPTGGTVTYTFTASQPGTYLYNSGTAADLQVEMGLTGAIIVRPEGFIDRPDLEEPPVPATARRAYASADSAYDHEYLFFLTDMDNSIHDAVEAQVLGGATTISVDTSDYFPVYWFINGRTAPDTLLGAGAEAPWLVHQPYNCIPMMNPGQQLLMRVVGAGRDPHPYHHHGNHARMIAKNGRLLSSAGASAGLTDSADLGSMHYTVPSFPGTTIDSMFTWTGEKMGWDIYGHKPDEDNAPTGWADGGPMGAEDVDWNGDGIFNGEDPAPEEYHADHLKPLPTALPLDQDVTFGQMYGGSPFLGAPGVLPPGEGGFNANNGFMYMWHSHNEKEIVNNDIFPGGMLTLLLIEAP